MAKKKKQTALVAKPEENLIAGTPAWVANVEDVGTAMMQAGQEMMLAVDDVLIRYFKMTDSDIKKFHQKLIPILKGVEEYEEQGLSMLSPHDISIVGDIAQHRFIKERSSRIGLETPILPGATPFLRALKAANDEKR